MRKTKRWIIFVTISVLLATQATAVAPFKKVSIATSTTTTTTTAASTTAEASAADAAETKNENGISGTTKNPKLTGIPQIDYIWDPNLPRELRGYNLSSYPFFSSVPAEEDIHFKCDGLHDGFYASIEHKCQLYHHCVYGIRHDFLCANFTAFDQKTFICHFVSDVDCEGSQKYWNRNDNLYMATTTTSTTTTTTEPPPTPPRRRVRPFRPLRRPVNRRPIDDYYYDEEEYSDDDYYEESLNQRRKQRPRHRKPHLEYEEEYDEKRTFSDEEKSRRYNPRDRFRETDTDPIEDYDIVDRRKHDRPKARNKAKIPAERRKNVTRRPTTGSGRSGGDERRSFGDERTINGRKDKVRSSLDDSVESVETSSPRALGGPRHRLHEKRLTPKPAADVDDLDYLEKTNGQPHDQEEAAEEEAPSSIKTTAKPLKEFITPKASSSSVYARPRAPPRIARPVPVNEKKKFEYSVRKTTATTPSSVASHSDTEEYVEYDDYDEPLTRPRTSSGRRRIAEEGASRFDNGEHSSGRRRTHNDTPLISRKTTRKGIRKPITDKNPVLDAEEDYETSNERVDVRPVGGRKRPYNGGRTRIPSRASDDVDFVDDDYDDHPHRPSAHRLRQKTSARKNPLKSRSPIDEEEDLYEAEPESIVRHRGSNARHKIGSNTKIYHSTDSETITSHDESSKIEYESEDSDSHSVLSNSKTASINAPSALTPGRPTSVRVVKRPFLPSRGGSPYLPRGLQPVGIAHKQHGNVQTTDITPLDMGSTISGVHLLEHGAPLLRDSGNDRYKNENEHLSEEVQTSPRTTLPPRSAIPIAPHPRPETQLNKATLDELYETDYDVTLNDALNPTLKPLSPHSSHHHINRNYASAYALSSPGATNPFINNNQSPTVFHAIKGKNHNNENNHNKNNNQDNYQQQIQQQQQQKDHQIAYQSLSPHHIHHQSSQQIHQPQSHDQQTQHQLNLNNYNSDSYFSSTDIRRRAIVIPAPPTHTSRSATQYRGVGTRIAQHFYDDFDY